MTDGNNLGKEPKLDAPGTGLPLVQEWLLKHVIFPVLRRLISRKRALAIFEKEGRVALSLLREMPESLRHQRILLPRMLGIEDSSRFWSMAMVLEHIMIVSNGVAQVIARLSSGQPVHETVSTAKVKPPIDQLESIDADFDRFLTACPGEIRASFSEDEVSRCHVHPWFGCLNPDGWIVMLAVHQWIHKRQIRALHERLQALDTK